MLKMEQVNLLRSIQFEAYYYYYYYYYCYHAAVSTPRGYKLIAIGRLAPHTFLAVRLDTRPHVSDCRPQIVEFEFGKILRPNGSRQGDLSARLRAQLRPISMAMTTSMIMMMVSRICQPLRQASGTNWVADSLTA